MKEALKLALEALCVAVEPKKGKVYAREFEPIDCFAMHEQAIIAITKALVQPEQEPTPDQMQAAYQAGQADAREDLTIAYMAGYSKGRDSMKAECVKAVHNCLNDYVFTADMAGHAGRHLQLAENAIKELK